MPTMLNALEPTVTWLLRVSGQAAVLVLLILLVQAICRDKLAPRWRYALWLLVVVRLLLPFPLASSFSIFNLARLQPSGQFLQAEVSAPVEPRSTPASSGHPVAPVADRAPAPGAPAEPVKSDAATSSVQSQLAGRLALPWWSWIALVWLTGAALLGLRIIWQNVKFYWRLRWEPTVTEADRDANHGAWGQGL